MKSKSILTSILLIALFFAACATGAHDIARDNGATPTVQDIFSETTTTEKSTNTTQTVEGPTSKSQSLGSLAIVPEGYTNWPSDETGKYMPYTGGEMKIHCQIEVTGSIAEKGVGLLIFIDGQPQPYKTDDEQEYAYLHTFYPESHQNFYTLSFTPVTGSQGDTLEIYIASVLYPSYCLSDGSFGFLFAKNNPVSYFRLKYEQTPPEDIYPEKKIWLSSTTVTHTDTRSTDIAGWSATDLKEKIEHAFYINGTPAQGKGDRRVYEVSAEQPVSLRYELWGSPYVNFGLVIFVDNVPVFDADVGELMLEIQSGQKTVVEAQLNLDQFDGESVVYAVLIPRNYRTSEVSTRAFLESSGNLFLLEESVQ